MRKERLSWVDRLIKRTRRHHLWKRVVGGLACLVVFCTTYALILPALTMEKETFCGQEAHQHTDRCFVRVDAAAAPRPECTYETLGVHVHTGSCYGAGGALVCGMADVLLHSHDASCYDKEGNLLCSLPEVSGHIHNDSCYAVVLGSAGAGHTHTDECYTEERGELVCGLVEEASHTHSESCSGRVLVCDLAESEGHAHTDQCRDEAGNLTCGLAESEGHHHTENCYETGLTCGLNETQGHTHTDECYAWNRVLSCGLEETPAGEENASETAEKTLACTRQQIGEHTHSGVCSGENGAYSCGILSAKRHVHTADCFPSAPQQEGLTCGLAEGETHTHQAACYNADGVLVCPIIAGEPHVHSSRCYGEWKLVCGLPQHEHTLSCYSDPTADVETARAWELSFAGVELTGVWADDLLAIAATQLNYAESTRNYVVREDGETIKGYTRYGDWYGNAYGEWCAMFVSFCLHYAGVENFPLNASCQRWIEQLSSEQYGLYAERQAYEPKPGDLVFFNNDEDAAADHVGIVVEVSDGSKLKTIEGNAGDCVRYATYALDDARILGYGRLPENPGTADEPEAAPQFTLTATTAEGLVVCLTGPESALPYPPEHISITAELVISDTASALVDAAVQDTEFSEGQLYLFDVRLWHDGVEIEPVGPVVLTFSGVASGTDEIARVFHVDETNEAATDMGAEMAEDGSVVVDTDHFSLYGVVIAAGGNVTINSSMNAVWSTVSNTLTGLTFTASSGTDKLTYRVEYSDDGGTSWTTVTISGVTSKNTPVTLNATGALSADMPLNRQIRVYAVKDNNNYGFTATVTVNDILDSAGPGFSDWLEQHYVQDFGYTALPQSQSELYAAFALYRSLPTVTISGRLAGNVKYVDAVTDGSGTYTYAWEYQDENGNWQPLCPDTGATINATEQEVLNDGGRNVRCKMYENGDLKAVSNVEFVNPLAEIYAAAIAEINAGLNLGTLAINGTAFTDYFYYGNVARDSRVPFSDAQSYADYLAKTYLDAGGGDAGLSAVRSVWRYYLYDLYDPTSKSNTSAYPAYTYGDTNLEWPKDSTSSFHSTGTVLPEIDPLNYDFLENGVDYSRFISALDKSVTAVAPGDANTERKYLVDITADAQAKVVGPVALVLQVQTSWQMFDIKHANALTGEGATSVGAVAYNTELANLYDIKHALLRFVNYMNTKYPGNNLVLGITEVQHAGSQTMLLGTDSSGAKLYVTNNCGILREALLNWDSFGNCEHVHYDNKALDAAVTALPSNLSGWEDFYQQEIAYEDIQKVAVIIGGPTENRESDNGYQCTLPWAAFRSARLNSVYGIRTNKGTSNGSGFISWLDYTTNMIEPPFVDGTGSTYTKKFVATTEDALFSTLVRIAETEMRKNAMDLLAEDKYVDDVLVKDTISDELFMLDTSEPITATVYNKDGSIFSQTVVPLDDPNLTITHNADGTTTVSYLFGRVYNTKKCVLHFGIQAREDYIGSNNVYSNVGTPDVGYVHYQIDDDGALTGESDEYTVSGFDTPQVNVPIRFDTTDGDTVSILVGETVDLADLSPAIVAHAENLIDNYDQISGTLSYVWVLPDGTEVDAGSVTVENGSIGAQNLPSREYEFTGTEAGQYMCTLKVTFTPDPVDTAGGNFSNAQTAEPVGALTKEGNVWINVYAEDSTERFFVQKEWVGGAPDDAPPITFRVLANGRAVTDETGAELQYTLSAANGWETEVSGLPSVIDGVIQEYTVEETPVPVGYFASYSVSSRTEEDYAAKVTLTFTPAADQNKKTLRITCTYNGQTYTYVTPQGDYKKNQSYSFVVDNLPLDENGEPYACELVSVFKVDDGKEVGLSSKSAVAERYLRGTTVVGIRIITNAPGKPLPRTGGAGTLWLTLGGLLCIAGALLYACNLCRRRERGANG